MVSPRLQRLKKQRQAKEAAAAAMANHAAESSRRSDYAGDPRTVPGQMSNAGAQSFAQQTPPHTPIHVFNPNAAPFQPHVQGYDPAWMGQVLQNYDARQVQNAYMPPPDLSPSVERFFRAAWDNSRAGVPHPEVYPEFHRNDQSVFYAPAGWHGPHQMAHRPTYPFPPQAHGPMILPPSRYVPTPTPAQPFQPLPPLRHFTTSPRPPVPDPVAPVATDEYLAQARSEPVMTTSPRPLLIVLDMNGTLIFRKARGFPPSFVERPGLASFLSFLFTNFKAMIWTSSQARTVLEVQDRLLTKEARAKLVTLWARDTLGLTKQQYWEKVQVYKQLEKLWEDNAIQAAYPKPPTEKSEDSGAEGTIESGEPVKWDQTNTVLIDDSARKAVGQPYNIIEIPEFTADPDIDEEKNLHTVMRQLRVLSYHTDVSSKLHQWSERRHEASATVNPGAVDDFWDKQLTADEEELATRLGGADKMMSFPEDDGQGCGVLMTKRRSRSRSPVRPSGQLDEVDITAVCAQRMHISGSPSQSDMSGMPKGSKKKGQKRKGKKKDKKGAAPTTTG